MMLDFLGWFIVAEAIAAVVGGPDLSGEWMEGNPDSVANPRGKSLLIRSIGIELQNGSAP